MQTFPSPEPKIPCCNQKPVILFLRNAHKKEETVFTPSLPCSFLLFDLLWLVVIAAVWTLRIVEIMLFSAPGAFLLRKVLL